MQPFEDEKPSPPTTTAIPKTPNPLTRILNRIFGDDRWKALLQNYKPVTSGQTTVATSVHSKQQQTEDALSQVQGFQTNQVSANNFQPYGSEVDSDSQFHTAHTSSSSVGDQRVENTYPGSHFYAKILNTSSSKDSGQRIPIHFIDVKTTTPAPNTPQPFFQQTFDNTQPLSSQMLDNNLGLSSTNEWVSSGNTAFDPNKINRQQQLYNPDSAFRSFITQTGSDLENNNQQSKYDADAANQQYMQLGLLHYPPGAASGQTEQGSQHSNGEYGTQPQFDPDALNHALIGSAFGGSGGNPQFGGSLNPLDMSPFHQPMSQSQTSESMKTIGLSHNTHLLQHKHNKMHNETSTDPSHSGSEPKVSSAQKQFGFIPGSLYPSRIQNSNDNYASRTLSGPSFLSSGGSNSPVSASGFDPNALNAAQALYNPNAMSWIKPRTSRHISGKLDEEDDHINISSTVPQRENNTAKISPTYTPSSSSNEKASDGFLGFDPNMINSKQGQSSFRPGQMMPSLSGGSRQNQQLSSGDFSSPYDPNSNTAMGINFNFQSLLGLPRDNPNSTNSGLGLGTSSGGSAMNAGNTFPASTNMNFNNMLGNTTSHRFAMSGFENAFGVGGFDPSAANSGTSGSSAGFGMSFGGNGFDPNAVNTPGFGIPSAQSGVANASNSGMNQNNFGGNGYPSMNGGGYGTGMYNANLINQQLIQNPYAETAPNVTGNSMASLLGVSPGGQTPASSYQSAFISAFDPSSVNQAVYDPNKFNTAHMNFDPLEMLSKNPGMDENVLQSASFDPNKANDQYSQINFSPMAMLGNSLGRNSSVVQGAATYNPASAGQASFIPSQIGMPVANGSSVHTSKNQPLFDPVQLMQQLMQGSGRFLPGSSGTEQMNFDPSAMFPPAMFSSTPRPHPTTTVASTTKSIPLTSPVTPLPTSTTPVYVTNSSTTTTIFTTTSWPSNSTKMSTRLP